MMAEKIFVVDDEVNLLNILKIQLGRAGYEVATFTAGSDAINQIVQKMPDLLIVDYMMPVMDGLEFTRKVKEDPATRSVPIIILSALNQTSEKLKTFEAGAEDYITKPYDIKELLARIRSAIARSKVQRPAQPEAPPKEGLTGRLSTISLPNLIQLLEMDSKTGILHVHSPSLIGGISFSKGKVVAASTGNFKGEKAVFKLLFLKEGDFEFEHKDEITEREITTSNQNLLLDAVRRKDELDEYKEIFPSLEMKVSLKDSSLKAQYESLRAVMKPEFMAILEIIKDDSTIAQVIEDSKQDEKVVLEELKAMLSANLIEVKP